VEWVTASQVLGLVGIAPPGTAPQAERAALVADAINVGMTRALDRADSDPVLATGDAELRAAAATAGAYAYRRFDTAFDSVGYSDLNGTAVKVARDALAYVAPQLERWRWVGVG
jgi:hypothetical protein